VDGVGILKKYSPHRDPVQIPALTTLKTQVEFPFFDPVTVRA
jgi:hypothetical protein